MRRFLICFIVINATATLIYSTFSSSLTLFTLTQVFRLNFFKLSLANIVSLLTAEKIGITIAHQRSILTIQKPAEALFRLRPIPFLYVKMFEFHRATQSL